MEIDAARESLAATLDQLTFRGNPKRLVAQGREAAVRFLQSPVGIAAASAVGLLVSVAMVQKVRHRND
jgi:hypothetical protein